MSLDSACVDGVSHASCNVSRIGQISPTLSALGAQYASGNSSLNSNVSSFKARSEPGLQQELRERYQYSLPGVMNSREAIANKLSGPWRDTGSLPLIVSHRAGGNEAPENTIAAVRAARKAGSRVMQMDILPTEDGIPVIFHDKQLKRATGVDKNITAVQTQDLPFLREHLPALLDAKLVINTRDFGALGYTIPTLGQLLDEVKVRCISEST